MNVSQFYKINYVCYPSCKTNIICCFNTVCHIDCDSKILKIITTNIIAIMSFVS